MRKIALVLAALFAIVLSACGDSGSDADNLASKLDNATQTTETPSVETTIPPASETEPPASSNCPDNSEISQSMGYPVETEFNMSDNSYEDPNAVFLCSYVVSEGPTFIEIINKKVNTDAPLETYQRLVAEDNAEYTGQDQLDLNPNPTMPVSAVQHDGHELGTHAIAFAYSDDAVCYAWFTGNTFGDFEPLDGVLGLVMDACGI